MRHQLCRTCGAWLKDKLPMAVCPKCRSPLHCRGCGIIMTDYNHRARTLCTRCTNVRQLLLLHAHALWGKVRPSAQTMEQWNDPQDRGTKWAWMNMLAWGDKDGPFPKPEEPKEV